MSIHTCDDRDTGSTLGVGGGVFIAGVVTAWVCDIEGRQVRVSVSQTRGSNAGRAHLRQPRRAHDADPFGCSSSVPNEDDPIALAAGFLRARSSGCQSDGAEQRMLLGPSFRFGVGASLELKRISGSSNPLWRQFYTTLPETNREVRGIAWDRSTQLHLSARDVMNPHHIGESSPF